MLFKISETCLVLNLFEFLHYKAKIKNNGVEFDMLFDTTFFLKAVATVSLLLCSPFVIISALGKMVLRTPELTPSLSTFPKKVGHTVKNPYIYIRTTISRCQAGKGS